MSIHRFTVLPEHIRVAEPGEILIRTYGNFSRFAPFSIGLGFRTIITDTLRVLPDGDVQLPAFVNSNSLVVESPLPRAFGTPPVYIARVKVAVGESADISLPAISSSTSFPGLTVSESPLGLIRLPALTNSSTITAGTVATSADQIIRMPAHASTTSTPAPSVKLVPIVPERYIDPDTFYPPSVAWNQLLTPSLFTETTPTFYAPSMTRGQVLAPGFFTEATEAFYAPTVVLGDVLAPGLFTAATATFYAPTVHNNRLTPALFTATNSFYAPEIRTLIQPSLLMDDTSFYAPTVVKQPYVLSPPYFIETDTVFLPIIFNVNLFLPSCFIETNAFFAPSIIQAGVSQDILHLGIDPDTHHPQRKPQFAHEFDPSWVVALYHGINSGPHGLLKRPYVSRGTFPLAIGSGVSASVTKDGPAINVSGSSQSIGLVAVKGSYTFAPSIKEGTFVSTFRAAWNSNSPPDNALSALFQFDQYTAGTWQVILSSVHNSGGLYFGWYNNGVDTRVNVTDTGQWVSGDLVTIGFSYGPRGTRAFINGRMVASTTTAASTFDVTSVGGGCDFGLGGDGNQSSSANKGFGSPIINFTILDRALNDDEWGYVAENPLNWMFNKFR